ncbi:MAG TPA: hypothetical protein VMJ70_02895 [Candidatus Sulfotelmatobacter sp.]|nr:hypothetical protein [Candidatus Sulfotelmatobacter sp.]
MAPPAALTRILALSAGALQAAIATLVIAPAIARASIEEFSTFSVVNQEKDDESMIDHFLTRAPNPWLDEWARSPQILRTAQGCLTSGRWLIDTDLRLRAPLGQRAWLGVNYLQNQSDILQYQYLDLYFNYPMPAGVLGVMFRAMPDKASQDLGFSWGFGSDTSAYQLNLTFTLEDVFNNFWAFRQTQVGQLSEPYQKRPYEPALHFATRHDHWRAEVSGKWLTSSRKSVYVQFYGANQEFHELWGAYATGQIERDLGKLTLGARGWNRQARDQDIPVSPLVIPDLGYRRQWQAEGYFRRPMNLMRGVLVQGSYIYQGRCEFSGPPDTQYILVCDDRMMNLDVTAVINRQFTFRAGGLFDRIGVDATRAAPFTETDGTRNESRAYFGLIARFGAVSVAGIEGIELDPEPYPVTFHHDKGFLQLQAAF